MEAPRPAGGPLCDRVGISENRCQLEALELVEQCRLPRHEYHHGARDPGGPQLGPLVHRRDAVAPGVERFEGPRHSDGSYPVGVRLHHREEPRAGDSCYGAGVLDYGSQVDVRPTHGWCAR